MRHATTMRTRLVVAGAGLGLVLAACGRTDSGGALEGSPPGSPPAATTDRVSVELKEWSVTPVPDRASAGQVSFDATNAGTMPHELVVLATALAPEDLPTEQGAVDEDGAGVELIGEIEQFAAGDSTSGTFTLDAGTYVLICNIPGHYQQGMRAALTVA